MLHRVVWPLARASAVSGVRQQYVAAAQQLFSCLDGTAPRSCPLLWLPGWSLGGTGVSRQVCLTASSTAKTKDKKKDKRAVVRVDEGEMSQLVDVAALRHQLDTALDSLQQSFVKQFSLRTAAGSVEAILVPLDGDRYPLRELAQVTRKSASLLVINCAAFPQTAADVTAALRAAGLGLNPQQEGTTIYLQIPRVTREHRESLAKGAKVAFNAIRDRMKAVQNNQIKAIKKEENVSEDLSHRVEAQVMALTSQYVAEAEALLKTKTADLLGDK